MSIPRPQIQKTTILLPNSLLQYPVLNNLILKKRNDFILGGRIVEPDRAFVCGIERVVGYFGRIEVVPAIFKRRGLAKFDGGSW